MKRIIHVVNNLNPHFGGTTSTVINIINSINNNDFKIDIVTTLNDFDSECIDETKKIISNLSIANVNVISFNLFPMFRKVVEKYGISFQLMFWMVKSLKKYSLIHCHGVWSLPSLFAILYGKIKGIPVLVSPHETLTNFDIQTSANFITRFLKNALKKYIIQLTQLFIFSSYTELRNSSNIPLSKSNVIYHPIKKNTTINKTFNKEKIVVGYLGRIHKKKNIDAIINCFIKLPSNYHLYIAGKGDVLLTKSLLSIVKINNLTKRIFFIGWLTDDEKDNFFKKIDLLCMPSEYECFGNSAAEALSYGIPVVVSKNTGIAELVLKSKSGLVISPNEPQLYKSLIRFYSEENIYDSLAKNAKSKAMSHMSFIKFNKAINKIYNNFL